MSAIEAYNRDTRRVHRRLTAAEERKLARAARKGDAAARDSLVASLLPYVIRMAAGKSQRSAVPFDDLVQLGNCGLLKAVDRFDPRRGLRLSTYATWWIRQSMQHGERRDTLIRVPEHPGAKYTQQADLVRKALAKRLSFEPGSDLLHPAYQSSDQEPCCEYFEQVLRLLNRLPPRWAKVMRLMAQGLNQRQVAARMGCTHQRVQQIRAGSIARLRELLGAAP